MSLELIFTKSERPEPLKLGPFSDTDLQQILSELPRGVGQLSGNGPLISAIHGSGYLRIRDVYIMLTPEQYEVMQDSYEELC